MTSHIISGGITLACNADVRTWHDHGLTFPKAAPRTEPLRWAVAHWTASGLGSRVGFKGFKKVYDNLVKRGCSVHMITTDDGIVWQCADPELTECSHAGRLNGPSMGLEFTGPGWLARHLWPRVTRRKYPATVHGWSTTFIDFTPEQHKSLSAVATTLGKAGIITPMVTTAPWNRRTDSYFDRHSGWCGHLHCDRLGKPHPKCDPGTAPLVTLDDYLDFAEERCPECGQVKV